jgi:hypothetical protein
VGQGLKLRFRFGARRPKTDKRLSARAAASYRASRGLPAVTAGDLPASFTMRASTNKHRPSEWSTKNFMRLFTGLPVLGDDFGRLWSHTRIGRPLLPSGKQRNWAAWLWNVWTARLTDHCGDPGTDGEPPVGGLLP